MRKHVRPTGRGDGLLEPSDDFPLMPAHVKAWLDERASYLGWPPQGIEWYGVLRKLPVEHWAALQWERRTVALNQVQFTAPSQQMLEDLSAAVFAGVQNAYSALGCSQQKIEDICSYVREHRKLPGTLIFLKDGDLLDVVDGCHRLSLYTALKSLQLLEGHLSDQCDAWVGYLSPATSA